METSENLNFIGMQRTVSFIMQREIVETVEKAFKGKVNLSMENHLIEKAKQKLWRTDENNSNAWLYFISGLDQENSNILIEFINQEMNFLKMEDYV